MKTAQARKSYFSVISRWIIFVPLVVALGYSTIDAVRAIYAVYTLPVHKDSLSNIEDAKELLTIRRHIQKHFISHSVYVPMEDIVITGKKNKESERLILLMQKACGKGNIYVWVPIRLRWPLIGEKVSDWCWKK